MEPVLRPAAEYDWITLLIIVSLVFAVMAKEMFNKRFLNFIILPFNNKYIFLYNKKDKLANWFNVFFTGFQLLNFALFVYLSFEIMGFFEGSTLPYKFVIVLACLMVFLLLKIVLQLGTGYIFNNHRVISEVIFKKLTYFNYSSLVMFLANVLLMYVFPNSKELIFIALLIILIINVIGWLTVIKNHQNYITQYFFYFILYLCALEIAPLILVAGYLKS